MAIVFADVSSIQLLAFGDFAPDIRLAAGVRLLIAVQHARVAELGSSPRWRGYVVMCTVLGARIAGPESRTWSNSSYGSAPSARLRLLSAGAPVCRAGREPSEGWYLSMAHRKRPGSVWTSTEAHRRASLSQEEKAHIRPYKEPARERIQAPRATAHAFACAADRQNPAVFSLRPTSQRRQTASRCRLAVLQRRWWRDG